jgi:hypothetical protein
MTNAEEQKLQRRNSTQWIEQITSSLIAWVFRIPSATCVFQELAEESQPDKNHWWKKGLPFDPFVPNQIRSAAKGSISPGSIENVGQGALVPVQKGPSVPVSCNSRD